MRTRFIIATIVISIISCNSSAENNEISSVDKTTELKTESILTENAKEAQEQVDVEEEKTTVLVGTEKKVKETQPKEVVQQVIEVAEVNTPAVGEVIRANHQSWNNLTKKYVTENGKVNYKEMKANLSTIKDYLIHLQNTAPKSDWSKNEKLAYWLNLYNASTVYLISSNYPVASITKINGGKPWDKKFVKSGDKIYSLNEIENNIVRPRFKDPRVHAALNCAAKSCPKLLNGAFLPANLNAQLDKQVRAWINDASKNKLEGDKAHLSQIFDWYAVDFKAKGGVIAFINKYISTNVALSPKAKITFLEYNWTLNE